MVYFHWWWWCILIGGGGLVLVHYGDDLVLVANCPAVFFSPDLL